MQVFGTRGTQRCLPFEHTGTARSGFSSKSSDPALMKAEPPDVPFQGCWATPPALFQPVLSFPCVCTAVAFMVSTAMLPVCSGRKPQCSEFAVLHSRDCCMECWEGKINAL